LRRSAWLWLGFFSCITLWSSGCGSGAANTALLRFVQASPDAPQVNVLIDGASVAGNLAYGNATGYISLGSGSRHIQVVPVSGSSPIFDQTLSFNLSSDQTLLLTGPAAGINPVMLTDGGTTTTTGDGYVRVVNASATMGAADVYLVPAGSSIVGVKPVAAGLAFDKNTGYQLVVAGNYEVFMTAPNTSTALLSTGSISLTSAQNQTVVALDGISSGFMYALLTDQ
jgi:Domain of unknown function (DUF4397)